MLFALNGWFASDTTMLFALNGWFASDTFATITKVMLYFDTLATITKVTIYFGKHHGPTYKL
jgi:hypothetical protein